MSDSRLKHPSLIVYLMTLVLFTGVVVGGVAIFEQQQRVDRSRTVTADSMSFIAELGSEDIATAVELTEVSVGDLAANPGLTALFATPTPEGCTLTFTGAGPFTAGHIDIIDRDGRVLCSSQELPDGATYRGEQWLTSAEPQVLGPVDDAGTRALVVLAPIQDLGVVATFLDIDSVPAQLEDQYGGTRPTDFELLLDPDVEDAADEEAISGEAEVAGLGWTVRTSVVSSEALDYARALNRQMTVFLVVALLLLVALALLVYRGVARPIRQLSGSVRRVMSAGGRVEPPTAGPAEVMSLGRDFATLTSNVSAELALRRQAESEARASEESYRTMFEANPQPTWVHDTGTGSLVAVNRAMVERFGWSREELLSMRYVDLLADDSVALTEHFDGGVLLERTGPWTLTDRDAELVECLVSSDVLELPGGGGRIVVAEDVTDQLRNERLLQRTQRMESLGQLAGGIAHDFNNVLAVMLNYAEFAAQAVETAAEKDPQRWAPVLQDVRQIGLAGDRAAELTRALLSFARGDSLETGPIDVNGVTAGIENLLRRTLGARVELEMSLGEGLWPVEANSGQLEQVIINLAVNARDAMPDGGSLSIETLNVEVDGEHNASRPERAPGRYVRLRVSDNGVGMDSRARDRAFEPFFTTKDRSSGTGLGLATVYGFVKRSGGTIDIYSEPGLGTTVSIYLPATLHAATEKTGDVAATRRRPGTETVLLVEDDEALRAMAERILCKDGYRVLTAVDGHHAESVAQGYLGEIDLLLTDVVMPGMLGSELAVRIKEVDPAVRVLFMSGYAPPVLVNGGTLPFDAAMVDKPFTADLLLGRVREVLDNGSGRPAGD